MADFVDRRLGGFCKDIQKQIEDLPLLNQVQKQKFIDMLNECASKADKAPEDSGRLYAARDQALGQRVSVEGGAFSAGRVIFWPEALYENDNAL